MAGRNDYDAYITNLYTHDLTTKFIQHYQIVDWEDGTPVNVGGAVNWTPEMKITLKDEDGSTLVLERGSNDPAQAAIQRQNDDFGRKSDRKRRGITGRQNRRRYPQRKQKRNRVLSAAVDLGCEDRRKSKIRR